MKVSKFFAGMSAAALAMSMMAVSVAAADDATEEEATPIATAYIGYQADAWVLDADKVVGTIEIPATGSWWDQVAIPMETFEAALAEGKTLDDVASITFGTSASDGKARNFTVGYNDTEGNWVQPNADATVKTATPNFTPKTDDTPEETPTYYLHLANNTDTDMKVDFVINYKGDEGLDDPHLNMVKGSWNNGYPDADSASGVKEDTADVFSGKEFTLKAYVGDEIDHMWWIAPTLVFAEDFGKDEDINARYEVVTSLKVDGEEVEIAADAKVDEDTGDIVHIWAEVTGANKATNTARVYGGYNEWGDVFVPSETFTGKHTIEYTITVTDTAAPEEEEEPTEEPTEETEEPEDEEPEEEEEAPAEEKKTAATTTSTTSNPKTAAVLGLGAIALAGAAVVVSKKK